MPDPSKPQRQKDPNYLYGTQALFPSEAGASMPPWLRMALGLSPLAPDDQSAAAPAARQSPMGASTQPSQPPRDHQAFLQDYASNHLGVDYDKQTGQLGRYDIQSPAAQVLGEKPAFHPVGPGFEQWLREKELGEPSLTRPVDSPVRQWGQAMGLEPGAQPTPPSHAADELKTAFRKIMEKDEGIRMDVYPDPKKRNTPTVGIGHKVLPEDHLRLGDWIDQTRLEQLFAQDSAKALRAAEGQAREAGITDPAFIARLASVNFQLGTDWNLEHKKTWALIKSGDYEGAAQEAARSDWYKQTPNRVISLQQALRALPPKGASGGR